MNWPSVGFYVSCRCSYGPKLRVFFLLMSSTVDKNIMLLQMTDVLDINLILIYYTPSIPEYKVPKLLRKKFKI